MAGQMPIPEAGPFDCLLLVSIPPLVDLSGSLITMMAPTGLISSTLLFFPLTLAIMTMA